MIASLKTVGLLLAVAALMFLVPPDIRTYSAWGLYIDLSKWSCERAALQLPYKADFKAEVLIKLSRTKEVTFTCAEFIRRMTERGER